MESKVRSAFTLVEILIVVIILGILAAIVVPQFTSASEDAQISNTETQLSTIRNQIELYRVRNNAKYPVAFTADLTWGDPQGGDAESEGLRGADYLKAAPVNPRTRGEGEMDPHSQVGGTNLVPAAGPVPAAGDTMGWHWDTTPGEEEVYAARFDEVNREWFDQ